MTNVVFGGFIALGLIRDLELLAASNNCVLWIRNEDFSQQLYLSSNYASLWERDCSALYEFPDSWGQALFHSDAEQFCHELKAKRAWDDAKHTNIYCVKIANKEKRWFQDRSFTFYVSGQKIIAGVALSSSKEVIESGQSKINEQLDSICIQYHRILSLAFPGTTLNPEQKDLGLLEQLTTKEHELLKLFLTGYTMRQAAEEINLSRRTVEDYLERIKNKLHCDSKSELITKSIELGWMSIMI
jgi:DNA-binding CsgD family transcriptional regulator